MVKYDAANVLGSPFAGSAEAKTGRANPQTKTHENRNARTQTEITRSNFFTTISSSFDLCETIVF
jgi:hypothetical protein